jgi:phosphoribosyl 1,2-cyclic phosphodiesterase
MRLTFLGTRGEIAVRSSRHRRHTATLVESAGGRILIDAGADWLGRLERVRLDAVILTHAHPDHVGALKRGSPCVVYATAATWQLIRRWPIQDRRILRPWQPCQIGAVAMTAVPVFHSVRAPAVGYRITHRRRTVFYVPDIAALPRASRALAGVQLYVGDGAAITRSILRRYGQTLTGHASIATQLGWCRDHGVARAVFTHCGSQIVRAHHRWAAEQVAGLGRHCGVEATIASDGDQIDLTREEKTPAAASSWQTASA